MDNKVNRWVLNPLRIYMENNVDISEGKMETREEVDKEKILQEVRKLLREDFYKNIS